MQIDWFTFSAQIINFLILLWLLRKFLYGPVLRVMENREKEIASRLEEARIKLEEAEQKEQKFHQKMEEIERQKSDWLDEAEEEADSFKKKLLREAREEVESAREKWMKALETEKSIFLEDIEQQSFQKIIDIVEHIVTDLADQSLESKAVDQFLSKVEQMDREDRQQMSNAIDTGNLEVATAFPPEKYDRNKIDETIRQLLGSENEYQYKQDSELGFGIEVRSNGWKIGWSMKTYLEELKSQIDTAFKHLGRQSKS